MLEMLAIRQKDLLKHLQSHKTGLTVDELANELGITRNAVRQHLASLEGDGLVIQSDSRPSGGRPQHLYVLTEKGKECFPRHYSWFAQLLVDSITQEVGEAGLRARLEAMGEKVADQLLRQHPPMTNRQEKTHALTDVMQHLGYEASVQEKAGQAVIEADNCVFHTLAMQNPEVCHFDLALMSKFTNSEIDHEQCMARGAHVCRFKLKAKSG
ncbi:MAG: HTH domain-containing protein [Burkholderiales bacterium]|nr:HTH domain-containing protein [Burkholderiales bacterium]